VTQFYRFASTAGARWGRRSTDSEWLDVLPAHTQLKTLLSNHADLTQWEALQPTDSVRLSELTILPPLDTQPVWAAGVTFDRSRSARKEESEDGGDIYDRVFDAERPELFFKSSGEQVVGHQGAIGIRHDSAWNVPEPELALVLNASGEVVAGTLGNDVSSRSIEGENPLYLPQAKVYRGSCALGPCIVPWDQLQPYRELQISLTIARGKLTVYEDTVELAAMRRSPDTLAQWLYECQEFERGAVLMTGTSIVPEPEITLLPGDSTTISAEGLGALINRVEAV
jgi:2-dehydro-3-deoxy-D-arabinonate dehydratase